MIAEAQRLLLRVPLAHAVHDEHARTPVRNTLTHLHGELQLPDKTRGIVIFVAASDCEEFAHTGDALDQFQQSGLATLVIDLLESGTGHFADASLHLPLLTEHLLAVLGQLTRLMDSEAVPPLPVGLFAAGDATPVAIRCAAVRDKTISALVCCGGLVDLAGLQYLREVKAPLHLLLGPDDGAAAANLARARQYMHGRVAAHALPDDGDGPAEKAAALAAHWFGQCFDASQAQQPGAT